MRERCLGRAVSARAERPSVARRRLASFSASRFTAVLEVGALLLAPVRVWAQSTALAAPTPGGQTLRYGSIDAAVVVRIFSLGSVETQRVQGHQVARDIALPDGGHGSGLLIDSRGLVITAKHMIEGAHVIVVRIPGDERVYPAVPVYQDPRT